MVPTLKHINPLCPWERFALEFYSCHSSNTKRTKAASFTTAAWCVSSQCGLMYCGRCLKKEKKLLFIWTICHASFPARASSATEHFPQGDAETKAPSLLRPPSSAKLKHVRTQHRVRHCHSCLCLYQKKSFQVISGLTPTGMPIDISIS